MKILASRHRLLLLLLSTSVAAQAEKPLNWTEAELALAGPYCIDTMGFKYGDAYFNTSPRARYWVGQMGPGFWAMHHYCGAMINLRRASGYPIKQREFQYHKVLDDLQYVVKNTSPDFVMLPEVFTRIGEVELLRNNYAAAAVAFQNARNQRPDYAPAYTHWARALIKLGKRSEAMAIVREGLAHLPRSKALLDLYRDLGGDANRPPSPNKPTLAASSAEGPPQPSAERVPHTAPAAASAP